MQRIMIIVMAVLLTCPALVAVGQWWWTRVEASHDECIQAAAALYGVDPALVKAVVWRESGFDPSARGKAGELGLMQLREIAAREWADHERVRRFRPEHCLDPVTNTLAGTYYLGKLLKRYRHTDNPVPYALADYNAGRSHVVEWVDSAGATNSRVFLDQIRFPATRQYVLQVMRRADLYADQP